MRAGRARVSRPVGRVLCARTRRGDGHPSRTAVADSLVQSTRGHRAGRPQSLAQVRHRLAGPLDLAPGGVYRAAAVTCGAGGLLHHRFTLTPRLLPGAERSVFCGTVPRVTPGRRYRPPCPVEPGPSSPGRSPARPPGRLTHRQAYAWRPERADDANDTRKGGGEAGGVSLAPSDVVGCGLGVSSSGSGAPGRRTRLSWPG